MQSEEKYFARDIFDILDELRAGNCKAELTERLNEVTRACQETGKSGSITLTLKVSPQGAQFIVADDIKTKVPEHAVQPTIMFADSNANLMRRDPRQMSLDDVVTIKDDDSIQVDEETGEIVKIDNE